MKWSVCAIVIAVATPASAQDIPHLERMPAEQRIFLHAVVTAQYQYGQASTDMQKGAARFTRESTICSRLPQLRADNWIGTVYKATTNSDGKGVLEIEIAPDVYVMTWNNFVSDTFDKTLIEPGSGLFGQAAQLVAGQAITFSGQFIKDGSTGGCLREGSLSLAGKVTEPEFVFRFSSVEPLR